MGIVLWITSTLTATLAGSAYGQAFVNQYPYVYQQQPAYAVGSYPGAYPGSYVNRYLLQQYHSPQDFFAASRPDLDRKVQDAVQLLTELRQNMNSLLVQARNNGDTYSQNALYRVDTASQDIMNFQRQLLVDRTTPFPQLEIDWENRVNSLFSNGLYTIMQSPMMWGAGPRARSMGFLCTLLLSTIALVIRYV